MVDVEIVSIVEASWLTSILAAFADIKRGSPKVAKVMMLYHGRVQKNTISRGELS